MMSRSQRAMAAAFSLAACAFLAGCLFDSPAPSSAKYGGSDTSDINADGTRRIQPPRVSYRTHDSIVFVNIAGTGQGYQNWYWIYRNGELLEQPRFRDSGSGEYHYIAYDTLREAGTFAYTVRYGYRISQLGPKSPAFAYAYPGRSPSGTVYLGYGEYQTVRVDLQAPPHSGGARARFERRTGPEGAIDSLATLPLENGGAAVYRDTGFVPYDTMLYYRAAILDGATEAWLAPTAWDSLRVFNRNWEYAPEIRVEDLGTGTRVGIRNPLASDLQAGVIYFLYRSRSATRADGTLCDSLPATSISLSLQDTPPDTGAWYYWVEARDSHGRTSPRAEPAGIRITGIPIGPDIRDITIYADIIYIRGLPYENATAYRLQRAADTSAAPVDVDTLSGPEARVDPAFADVPPGDGYWYYRVIAVADGQATSPGRWSRSGYLRRRDAFAFLSAPIRNLGLKGVQAQLPYSPSGLSLLYRSSRPDGTDSTAVDSVLPGDTSKFLRDMPSKGSWYYRAYTYPKPSGQNYVIYRTAWVRVDFTGNAVGPAVLDLIDKGMGIDVILASDPDAIAYVLERSADTSGVWTVADTLSVSAGSGLTYSDRPPRNGNWSYRARTLSRDLALTDPGQSLATSSPWVYRVSYENYLSVQIVNRGSRVECPLTTTSAYGYYLKRGPSADYSDPLTVDSALIGDSDEKMTDAPPRKAWYYWVERMVPAGVNSGAILRSVPVRVDFTGAPEPVSLARVPGGIQVAYPKPGTGDTLEIWRSKGQDRDTSAFSLVQKAVGPYSPGTWIDAVPAPGESGFYNYRLIMRGAEVATGFGPVKTFYYEPD